MGRPRRRWEEKIKIEFWDIGIDVVNWIRLAQYSFQWRTFVSAVVNLRFP
jgi:hypothetical protein